MITAVINSEKIKNVKAYLPKRRVAIMKKFLIIPDRSKISESLEAAEKYGLGFEYNEFFMPDILDSEEECGEIINMYSRLKLPEYCTLHGAFFDVTVFSPDEKIRHISDLRVRQSISAAERIGARAVVFHTNYNPFLNSEKYVDSWIEQNTEYWGKILREYSGINIYFENMFDNSPDVMRRLAERLCTYGNFGLCLDYAHASLTKAPCEIWAEKLGKYVRHMHINDNDLIGDLHLAVGDGKIDWKKFYGIYEKYMNEPTILIETPTLENQMRSVKKLIDDGFMEYKG